MTTTADNPIEIALLARLMVRSRRPPSEAEVLRSLRPLFGGSDPVRADQRIRDALARLEAEGSCTSDRTLTAKGRERACQSLGLVGSKVPTDWRALKGVLVEIALGRPKRGGRALTAGAVRAAALARKLGIHTPTSRPSDVLDAWAARELGMDGQRLTVANVRAHALSRALGIASLRDPKTIGAVATAKVLGVPRTDASTVRDAVLREWLSGAASSKGAPDGVRAADRASEEQDLHGFASSVKALAHEATDGRFGRHKVFIAPIWERARSVVPFCRMSESEFKARLVEAHRAGLLRLSRADLTPAMAPELVAASEAPYLNSVFHFVDLEGTVS